jgi:putative ABC transport system substrate-binding protein
VQHATFSLARRGPSTHDTEFITLIGGVAAWPLGSRAQQAATGAKPFVIGYLGSAPPGRFKMFQQGLRETGFVEGRNIAFEIREAEGAQLSTLADELVRIPVDVIFAGATSAALAAKRATSTIPIVFFIGGDPVRFGLVDNLNRPNGNVTGVSFLINNLVTKQLELLSKLVPGKSALGMLVDPANPNVDTDTRDAQSAAADLGRRLFVAKASSESELEPAFEGLQQENVAALLVGPNVRFVYWVDKLAALAAHYTLPTSTSAREFVASGGLMSYTTDVAEALRQSGIYVGKILKGARLEELPVVQSTKFQFTLNLKTAKTLGLEVPPTLLAIADEVIE